MNSPTRVEWDCFQLTCTGFSEKTLLNAAKQGEQWAFEELCRRYSHRVYLTIHRITKNREDAEDALQIALLSAFKSLHQFDSRAQFSTWLTKIGMNAAFAMLRKRRACREVSMAVMEQSGDQLPDWEPEDDAFGPRENCLQKEMYDQLHLAIELLPAIYRSLTRAQIDGEMSMKQLAEMFELSVAATKSRILRAKKLLNVTLTNMRSKPAGEYADATH